MRDFGPLTRRYSWYIALCACTIVDTPAVPQYDIPGSSFDLVHLATSLIEPFELLIGEVEACKASVSWGIRHHPVRHDSCDKGAERQRKSSAKGMLHSPPLMLQPPGGASCSCASKKALYKAKEPSMTIKPPSLGPFSCFPRVSATCLEVFFQLRFRWTYQVHNPLNTVFVSSQRTLIDMWPRFPIDSRILFERKGDIDTVCDSVSHVLSYEASTAKKMLRRGGKRGATEMDG